MQPVLRGVGFLLHVPALMALVSMVVCALFGEWFGLYGFALMAAGTLLPGQIMVWTTRDSPPMQRFHAMRIAAIAWLLASIAGTVPFMFSAYLAPGGAGDEALSVFREPFLALFESVSGFTSTGLSVCPAPAALPHHLQWWRSFTEWVGGIGVVVLLLTVLPTERSSLYLYFSEAREEKILPTVKSTVRAIWAIFGGFTVFGIVLLWITGEPWWRAINHAMTAISTGGFSITNDSIVGTTTPLRLAYVVLMVLGSISFAIHYRILRERSVRGALRESPELRQFLVLLIGGSLVIAMERLHFGGDAHWTDSMVQWVSALSTTGFTSGSVTGWNPAPLLLLVVAMMIGAMGGSTGSGMKQARVSLLFRDLAWNLNSFRSTAHEVVRINYGGRRLHPDEMTSIARNAALVTTAYIVTWTLGVLALLHTVPESVPLEHIFFEAASAQGNVGLSTGITNSELSNGTATTLIVLMIAGRLEIFPLIVLAGWLLRRR